METPIQFLTPIPFSHVWHINALHCHKYPNFNSFL
nr:MAG TPA: UPA domain protein [Herelleviridae sp.]